MTGRDFLWCALHLLLDEEEVLARLCPTCRAQAQEEHCPVCGGQPGELCAETNGAFDWERFQALREG
ncbi:MAG: molybdopterin oxidoreductase [Ruminiclostridium sp.]|nr:molybdopterin oxidoreductase [Ruminiclostridium sp.]